MSDPLHKFLGVTGGTDAFRLLALTPGQRHPLAVQRSLEAQLARVNRHPENGSPEAAMVRQCLLEAARQIREGDPAALTPRTIYYVRPGEGEGRQPSAVSRQPPPASGRPSGPLGGASPARAAPPPVSSRRAAAPVGGIAPAPMAGAPGPSVASRPAGAPAPPVHPSSPARRTSPPRHAPGLDLTPFDRCVLAMLIAYGGWNAASRAKLVAMAASHGVSPQGLMKVVTGLTSQARHAGRRIDVAQVTQGAARFVDPGATVDRAAAPQPEWADSMLPELRGGGAWATFKLSILFGAVTLLMGVLFVRMLMQPDPRSVAVLPPDGNSTPGVVTPGGASGPGGGGAGGVGGAGGATPAAPGGSQGGAATGSPRLVPWSNPPTFRGDTRPRIVADALDQSPRLPAIFDQLGRQLTVVATPSRAALVDWRFANDQIGLCWPVVEQPLLDAVRGDFFEVLFAVSDRPTVVTDLVSTLAAQAGKLEEPADVWRGAWAAGMLGAVLARSDAPAVLRDEARRVLEQSVGDALRDDLPTFDLAAAAWLDRAATRLVSITEIDRRSPDFWEFWLAAQSRVGTRARFDAAMIAAIGEVLRSSIDLARDGPTVNVLGRLVEEADFRDPRSVGGAAGGHGIGAVREGFLGFFSDPQVTSRDLWALGSLLAARPGLRWYGEDLIVPDGAETPQRLALMRLVERRWPSPSGTGGDPSGRTIAGTRIVVNPALGERWRGLAQAQFDDLAALRQPVEQTPERYLRRLVLAAWLNEAAAALATRDEQQAHDLLRRLEVGWQATTSGGSGAAGGGVPITPPPGSPPPPTPPRGPGGVPIVPIGGGGSGGGVPLQPGSPSGVDGQWKQAYDQAIRNNEERMNLLRSLRNVTSGDLGPIDARAFVLEVYRAGVPEIRAFAQAILLEMFSAGPNVAIALVDLFPDAQARDSTSELISSLSGRLLPSVRSSSWKREARLALVTHALRLLPTTANEIDEAANVIARSWAAQAGWLKPDLGRTRADGRDPSPSEAVDRLLAAWRALAGGMVVSRPIPDVPAALERRHETRLLLAEGPIERSIASQVTILEHLAFVVAGEQPILADDVLKVLGDCARARRDAVHVLEQAIQVEAAQARLWSLRLSIPEAGGSGWRQSALDAGERRHRGIEASTHRGVEASIDQGAPRWASRTRPAILDPQSSILIAFSSDPPDWTPRLEALTPRRPEQYFDLAEEVADAAGAGDEAALGLARHLFRLAGVLDPDRLGRGACLALADLERDPAERRRLLALATLLNRRSGEPNWLPSQSSASDDDFAAAVALADAFSHYRSGYGSRAEAALNAAAGARDLLRTHEHVVGGERRFLENLRAYRSGQSPVRSRAEVIDMLRLEAALLAGEGRTWSGDLMLSRGRTLVEVDPERLAEALGVDASRPLYRQGRWVFAEGRE